MARKQKYTQAEKDKISPKVLLFMSEGLSCKKACDQAGVPQTTFLGWVNDDTALAERYARAREEMQEAIAQEIMEISDETPAMIVDQNGVARYDSAAVQHQRLRVDSRKWLLSKVAPKKYGDKLELSGDKEAPLAVIVRGDDANL